MGVAKFSTPRVDNEIPGEFVSSLLTGDLCPITSDAAVSY